MSQPKNIGIVADNFKVEKFKKELLKEGFSEISTAPFMSDTTTITIKTTLDKVEQIYKICKRVELHFKHGN